MRIKKLAELHSTGGGSTCSCAGAPPLQLLLPALTAAHCPPHCCSNITYSYQAADAQAEFGASRPYNGALRYGESFFRCALWCAPWRPGEEGDEHSRRSLAPTQRMP